jgi:oligopeptide transport system substrate-binding protein
MDVLPDVARSWEISGDGRRYVFRLRPDARWSDGAPVTAGDFEYSWKRALHPAVGSPNASMLYDVKGARAFHQGERRDASEVGVRAADDRTLVVDLEEPTGHFLHVLACAATYPLPRHVVEKSAKAWTEGHNLVTNGPFRLESWERGKSMTFVRNPKYHGSSVGNLERVHVALLPKEDWRSALSLYATGNADLVDMAGVTPSAVEDAQRSHPDSKVLRFPRLSAYYLVFDVTRPPFDDPQVRRAFVLGTDRGSLASAHLITGLLPATGGFTPPGMAGHCKGIAPPYDPERARQLLAEAGYPDGKGFPAIECLMVSGPATPAGSTYFQSQWRQNLGLDIPWEAMEWGEYVERVRHEPPHIFLMGWEADYPDPDSFLRVAIHQHAAWRSEPYEELVERARRTTDQGDRMRLYRQAETILADEAPILVVDYAEEVFLVQPWVKSFPHSAGSAPMWKDVVVEPH